MAAISCLMVLFIVPGLAAMPRQEVEQSAETIAVTDMRGRSISVPEQIDKIIALGAGSLRLISYLDATDKVIAVENAGHGREKTVHDFFTLATYRLVHPELRELPSIGSAENHEGIIAAAPDLIIWSAADSAQLDQLQNVLGIPVFGADVDVELYDTELFYRQLTTLGGILNREDRAKTIIEGIEAALEDLASRAEAVEEPKRAYAGGMMYFGPADLLRTTGDYLPFDLTGTVNAMPSNPAGNRQPYMTSLEDLAAAAPDYVFIDAANIKLSKAGFMTNRQVLEEQVPAFAAENVYTTLVYKYYGTNWENQLINIYYAGTVLYPALYSDISIEEKAEEIWQMFFGMPLEYDDVIALQKTGPGRTGWFN